MTTDFMLNKCGDIKFTNGRLVRASGVDAIRQKWLIKVRKIQGEWLLDANDGLPYFDQILVMNQYKEAISQIYRNVTLEVPGVSRVNSIKLEDPDPVTRAAALTVDATLDGGESIQFRFDGTLGIGDCAQNGLSGVSQDKLGATPVYQDRLGSSDVYQDVLS